MNPFKPISISLSPNTEKDDILLALRVLFSPWVWWRNKMNEEVAISFEDNFRSYLGAKHAVSFNSGRSSLIAIFHALGFEKGSEVLLQAFTCNAVVNPIIWAGLKPVFVDCDSKSFNIDPRDLKNKITSKSRAVIVQHTFGLPCEIDEILKICQSHNLILIEDCVHALGAEYRAKKIGTFGKLSFFSFSRDKVISSVYGGMVVTDDDFLAERLREYQKKIDYPSICWTIQQLIHPILMNLFILPTYIFFGKYLLFVLQVLGIMSKAIHRKEKRGEMPSYFPKRLPPALALLANHQFGKLTRFNYHRKKISDLYRQELKNTSFQLPLEREQVYLRFSIQHPLAHEIIRRGWKKNILIGDWYNSVVAPIDTDISKMGYVQGSCPNAEKLSRITLNLPTHINISGKEVKKIIKFLEEWK